MTTEQRIVVGLDGSPSSWLAMEWAAGESRRTGRRLLLAYAVGDSKDGYAFGRELLIDAAARLITTSAELDVHSVIRDGDAASVLVDLARDADLLVVGLGAEGLRPLRVGSVTDQVLAANRGPTVVVGTGAPTRPHTRPNVIVVGASDSVGAAAALDFACTEAQRLGATVEVVRSWSVHERRHPRDRSRVLTSPDVWRAEEKAILDCGVQLARHAYPTVSVRSSMSGEPVEVALERASLGAALVVVGCRSEHESPRLGPVASWAVHHLDCPVAVVGPATAGRVAADYLDAGTALLECDAERLSP